MRGAIAWMARNPVAANILMVVLLAGGLYSTYTIQKEFLPDTNDDAVTVSVTYTGASPEEIEQGVILAIEEAVGPLTRKESA